MSSLQVEADVSESNLERVKVGQPCEITLDAFPEKRYRGIVHMIVPTADRAKATVLTKVRFVDKDEQVLPEMSAKVAFLTEELSETQINEKPKILVDPAAVVDRQNSKVVFLVKGEEVVEKVVKVDKMVGNALEVLDGIAPGDQVVLNPDGELKNGTKIKVIT
jgi:multidrug efflux pump subunit AcrA (membrane-fusion protein)